MVREESSVQKARSFRLKKMLEIPGRQAHSYVLEGKNGGEAIDDKQFRSHGARVAPIELMGSVFNPSGEKGPVSRLSKEGGRGLSPHSKDQQPSGMPFWQSKCFIQTLYLHLVCFSNLYPMFLFHLRVDTSQ